MSKDQPDKDHTADEVIDAEFEPVNEQVLSGGQRTSPYAGPLLWGLFVLAIVLGGILGIIGGRVLFPAPMLQTTDLDTEIAELKQELSKTRNQLHELSAQAKNAKENTAQITANTRAIADIQDKLQKAASLAPDQQQFEEALSRIELLENRPAATISDTGELDINAITEPLQQQISALQAKLETAADLAPEAKNLILDLENRLQALEASSEDDISAKELAALNLRIDALQNNRQQTGKSASATLALADLKLAAQGSDPFPVEYAAVRLQFADHEGIKKLAPMAATGVATRQQLKASLSAMIPDILRAASRPDDGAPLTKKAGSAMRSLITIRRTDGKGSELEIQLAEAEKQMAAGNLGAAISQISAIKNGHTQASKNWLQQARARQNLEQVLAGILSQHSDEVVP